MTYLTAPPVLTFDLTTTGCVASPSNAVCGYPICGDGTVCGGMSFTNGLACLEPDPTIVGMFICAQRRVGGNAYIFSTETFVLDLVPAEALG